MLIPQILEELATPSYENAQQMSEIVGLDTPWFPKVPGLWAQGCQLPWIGSKEGGSTLHQHIKQKGKSIRYVPKIRVIIAPVSANQNLKLSKYYSWRFHNPLQSQHFYVNMTTGWLGRFGEKEGRLRKNNVNFIQIVLKLGNK